MKIAGNEICGGSNRGECNYLTGACSCQPGMTQFSILVSMFGLTFALGWQVNFLSKPKMDQKTCTRTNSDILE